MANCSEYTNQIYDTIGKPGRILPLILKDYALENGLLTPYKQYEGTYGIVYSMTSPNKPSKCIRIWKDKVNNVFVKEVSEALNQLQQHGINYIMGYEYFDRGLLLDNGEAIPAVVMDWIDGQTLSDFIKENYSNSTVIHEVANNFYSMANSMKNSRIAHGDLSSNNIMVRNDRSLLLIDYDTFYTSKMPMDIPQTNSGTGGYQHRERCKNKYLNVEMDNFSQQVIYLALLAVSAFPKLAINDNLIDDTRLFFNELDFESDTNFISSPGYKAIASINNSEVKGRLEELRKAVNSKFSDVRSIVEFKQRPSISTQTETFTRPIGTSTSATSTRTTVNPIRTSPTQTGTPWYKKWYVWVGAAVLMSFFYFTFGQSDSNKNDGETVQTEMKIATAISRLEGNYTLREKNSGVSVNEIRTAAIKKTSESQARILVSTEYGPEIYDFIINENGDIESEQLGKGEISYNERLDKITLTFKQEERICEFTK